MAHEEVSKKKGNSAEWTLEEYGRGGPKKRVRPEHADSWLAPEKAEKQKNNSSGL
jgi:hypothetical protein